MSTLAVEWRNEKGAVQKGHKKGHNLGATSYYNVLLNTTLSVTTNSSNAFVFNEKLRFRAVSIWRSYRDERLRLPGRV